MERRGAKRFAGGSSDTRFEPKPFEIVEENSRLGQRDTADSEQKRFRG